MPVESTTTIPGLNDQWPLGSDPKSEGDNHIRMIKDVLQTDALSLTDPKPVSDVLQVKGAAPEFQLWQGDQLDDEKLWATAVSGVIYSTTARDDDGTVQAGSLALLRNSAGIYDGRLNRDGGGVGNVALVSNDSIVTRISGDGRYVQTVTAEADYLRVDGTVPMVGQLTLQSDVTAWRNDSHVYWSVQSAAGVTRSQVRFDATDNNVVLRLGDGSGALTTRYTFEELGTLDELTSVVTRSAGDARYMRAGTNTGTLYGTFNGTGGSPTGSAGWTVSHTSTGTYLVTFDEARTGSLYTVVVSPRDVSDGDGYRAYVTNKSTTTVAIENRGGGGLLTDTNINFIVMG